MGKNDLNKGSRRRGRGNTPSHALGLHMGWIPEIRVGLSQRGLELDGVGIVHILEEDSHPTTNDKVPDA